ncbi:MAG: RNA 2',3'-cyclic phosphodiesterase [Bryobacterales bacterium]|nr:RNA 2',3'-cyclic phosphodiesterase [Bryobacterales bacterium]
MRLFTGIELPAGVAGQLTDLIARLKPHAHIRWSRVENLHITTKFIGEWPEERLPELQGALGALPRGGVIPITLKGLGWFPNPHSPRIFWVAVEGGEALRGLAAGTEAALEPLGIAREARKYTPHLTLARVEAGSDLAPLRRAVAQLPLVEAGSFVASEFHLYESRQGAGGSIYTKLHTVAL